MWLLLNVIILCFCVERRLRHHPYQVIIVSGIARLKDRVVDGLVRFKQKLRLRVESLL